MNTIKSVFKILISNIATIIAGVVVSFVVPKIFTLEDYGFYKTFTLYFNYLGVLSLGIIDGIVLQHGEKDYSQLDRQKFRSYFSIYAVLQISITLISLFISMFVKDNNYQFIIIILALNLIPMNLTGYLQQISQITQRFQEYSIRKTLQAIANILLVVAMLLLYQSKNDLVNFKFYMVGLLLINMFLAAWYLVTYREIIFGKREKNVGLLREVFDLIKIGFPLLLANLCTTLILSLDRQFVSVLFDLVEYGVYSFAYSMLSFVTVATSAISVVIYPIFKRLDLEKIKNSYSHISSLLLIFIFFAIIAYFPLAYFIEWFLPKYTYSISIFKIILPGLAMSSVVTVIMHNYYKVLGKNNLFFRKSLVILLLSAIFNIVAYLLFKTREAISVASVIVLFVWYLYCEWSLRKECSVNKKGVVYLVIMLGAFYGTVYLPIRWIGFIAYFVAVVGISFLFYGREIKNYKNILKKE